jgi:hypothetical protein
VLVNDGWRVRGFGGRLDGRGGGGREFVPKFESGQGACEGRSYPGDWSKSTALKKLDTGGESEAAHPGTRRAAVAIDSAELSQGAGSLEEGRYRDVASRNKCVLAYLPGLRVCACACARASDEIDGNEQLPPPPRSAAWFRESLREKSGVGAWWWSRGRRPGTLGCAPGIPRRQVSRVIYIFVVAAEAVARVFAPSKFRVIC